MERRFNKVEPKKQSQDDFIKAYIKARDTKYEKFNCQGQYCEQFDGECEICFDNRRRG